MSMDYSLSTSIHTISGVSAHCTGDRPNSVGPLLPGTSRGILSMHPMGRRVILTLEHPLEGPMRLVQSCAFASVPSQIPHFTRGKSSPLRRRPNTGDRSVAFGVANASARAASRPTRVR